MEYWGISINLSDGSQLPQESCVRDLPEVDFLEIQGQMLMAEKAHDYFSGGISAAVREIMPVGFIRSAKAEGGKIFSGFRQSFREHLSRAKELNVMWVSADFGLENIKKNDTAAIGELREMLEGFYGNLLENDLRLLLDIRWPWSGGDGRVWAENISYTLSQLPFPMLGAAFDLHVHEAGAAEKTAFLAEVVKAWRLRTLLLRFHYEPEIGNNLAVKAVQPVRELFMGIGKDIYFSACPLIKNAELLANEAENFLNIRRGSVI